jgi:glycosyltransferase involved in cell wall biosynthesis
MKILIADQYSELGGAQRVLLELLPAIEREGWEIVLALPGDGALRKRAEERGVHCEEIACGPFGCGGKSVADYLRFAVQFPKLTMQLRRLVDQLRPDVVYLNGPRLVPAASRLGIAGPPIVFHAHSYLRHRSVAFITAQCLRRVRASVIANCQFVLEPLRECAAQAEVIYNGVPDCAGTSAKPRSGKIGIIGRISPEKGQHVLLRAARLLQGDLPETSFVIYGDAQFSDDRAGTYLRDLRRLADGLPVEFAGWREDIGDVLHGLDLLVVASLPFAEATTRVIPEAYSAGVPVVASDLPGIREILRDGETGFLFAAGEPPALATRIREVVAMHPSDIARVIGKARCEFERRFSLDAYHRRMISSLQRAGARVLA